MFDRLIHVGTVVVDLVAAVPALPVRGGDVLAEHMGATPGGGFNVMVAAARLGLPVTYAGPHGTGPFGDLARAALAAAGITVLQRARAVDTGLVITLVALGGGAEPLAAARTANAAAAYSVTVRGPATAPTSSELTAFLASREARP